MTRNEALTLRGKLIGLRRETISVTGQLAQVGRANKDLDSAIRSTIYEALDDAADLLNKLDLALEQVEETLR